MRLRLLLLTSLRFFFGNLTHTESQISLIESKMHFKMRNIFFIFSTKLHFFRTGKKPAAENLLNNCFNLKLLKCVQICVRM